MTTQTTTINPIRQIEALAARLEKARAIVAEGKVHPIAGMEDHYAVIGTAGAYIVNGECNCPDAAQRVEMHWGFCKHRLATLIYREQQEAQASQEATTDKGKEKGRKAHPQGQGEDTPTVETEGIAHLQEATGAAPTDAEVEEMRRRGHWVPGDPSPLDDGRSLEEQLKDIGL
jgi:hypothetical protein